MPLKNLRVNLVKRRKGEWGERGGKVGEWRVSCGGLVVESE